MHRQSIVKLTLKVMAEKTKAQLEEELQEAKEALEKKTKYAKTLETQVKNLKAKATSGPSKSVQH